MRQLGWLCTNTSPEASPITQSESVTLPRVWIAFQLVLALVGFAIRYARRQTKFDPTEAFDDVPYRMKIRRWSFGINGFSLQMPRRSPTWLRLHAETAFDRWAKRVGLSREIETGDARFDGLVYVTCDHAHVEKSLGVPLASIQLVADTNRALDSAQPKRASVGLRGCEVREHRGKGGRVSYSYHLMLTPEPSVTGDRDSFGVTRALCNAAYMTDRAEVVIGPGRWSLPWYREITVAGERWSAAL
jgi:hypothetical protein